MKKIISVFLAICLIFSLSACDFASDIVDSAMNIEAESKNFEFGGLSVELTTDFLRMDFVSEDYDFVVGDSKVTVMGSKKPHTDTGLGDLPVIEFAENFRALILDSNPSSVTEIDGIPTFQYSVDDGGDILTAAVMFYKSDDCFWAITFAAYGDDFEKEYDNICKYAKSVKC